MKTKILIVLIIAIIIISGGVWYWYSQIPRCPESCNDGNPCTQDFCSPETDYQCKHSPIVGPTEGCKDLMEICKQYQCVEGECQIVTLADCCGNEKCETGEDWETCPQDCELCNDGNPCTQDIYSYETNKCSYINLTGKQSGCLATVTCGSQTCKAGVCQIEYILNCCGNKVCEMGETYETCSADCPNCNDKNECTIDEYDYHKHECVNTPILDVICCGNTVCEIGETYESCPRDCPNCDDGNECTEDSYDYHEQKCINEPVIPCCGNGICDEGVEEYSNCPTDCPDCDDNSNLTADSFNYETQECEYITYYFYDDFDEGSTSWGLESRDPRWSVEFPEDETNGMLTVAVVDAKGGYTGYTSFGDQTWTDYTFYLKVKREQERGVHIYVRISPTGAYGVFITDDYLKLWKDVESALDLEVKEYSFALNQFYNIKIEVRGNNIKVYVNNNLEISYTDEDSPLLVGNVGLEPMSKAYFDDIIVEAPQ